MSKLLATLKSFMNDRGASAVEYGLLVAAIAAVIVVAVFALGGQVTNSIQGTCTSIANAAPGAPACPPPAN